jgi:hypothetical protein
MDTELLIGQAVRWLEQNQDNTQVEVLVDLPDINWVHLKVLQDQGSVLEMTYRGLSVFDHLKGDIELMCERRAITAVRRVPVTDIDLLF